MCTVVYGFSGSRDSRFNLDPDNQGTILIFNQQDYGEKVELLLFFVKKSSFGRYSFLTLLCISVQEGSET